jgi:hypothetical protein
MKRLFIPILLLISICLVQTNVNAQNTSKKLIQFSGVIVTGDSSRPVPFVTVVIKGTTQGTVTDFNGFFSFPAAVHDTIDIKALGFKRSRIIIPAVENSFAYSRVKKIDPDTFLLKTAVIYPWTIGQFKQMFLSKKVPDDDLERAHKNLARADMKERYIATPMDGSMNYKNFMNQRYERMYYAGQYPPNRLLDPFAWARFIQAWQKGELKIQPPKGDE